MPANLLFYKMLIQVVQWVTRRHYIPSYRIHMLFCKNAIAFVCCSDEVYFFFGLAGMRL